MLRQSSILTSPDEAFLSLSLMIHHGPISSITGASVPTWHRTRMSSGIRWGVGSKGKHHRRSALCSSCHPPSYEWHADREGRNDDDRDDDGRRDHRGIGALVDRDACRAILSLHHSTSFALKAMTTVMANIRRSTTIAHISGPMPNPSQSTDTSVAEMLATVATVIHPRYTLNGRWTASLSTASTLSVPIPRRRYIAIRVPRRKSIMTTEMTSASYCQANSQRMLRALLRTKSHPIRP